MSNAKTKDEEWVTVQKWNRFTKEDYKANLIAKHSTEDWQGLQEIVEVHPQTKA